MLRASFTGLEVLIRESAQALAQLDQLLKAIDRELTRTLRALPEGATRCAQFRSIPGIGLLSGAALTELFSRVGFSRIEAAIAYTGFDPRACDSGQHRGRRRLSKRGPAELRRLLYNAAMSASRTKTWKPFYERQRAKGLPSTAALVVLARKLLRVAYALYHHDANFDPRRIEALT
jgi:transposase